MSFPFQPAPVYAGIGSNQVKLGLARTKLRAHLDALIEALRTERYSFWTHWREIAEYLLPRRYKWLITPNRGNRGAPINQRIIDETGVVAWRTLSSGMLGGITSPGRPWFRITTQDASLAEIASVKLWCAEVQSRMLTVMGRSNYYTAKATQYGDLAAFGTAPMLIYDDFDTVIRCYTPCAGEYFVANDNRLQIGTFAREFVQTTAQLVKEYGKENCSQPVQQGYADGGAGLTREVVVYHAIEPNDPSVGDLGTNVLPSHFKWRECYWERGADAGQFLRIKGYYECPFTCPRWDVSENDAYGRSPAMDALGSLKQLQVEQKAKGVGILKHVDPPLLGHISLKNEPASVLPSHITYVQNLNEAGMKPVYQVTPDLNGLINDIVDVRERIDQVFFKDLFMMISQLDTVRTATEIDARREEKLIQLGPVLERNQGESLDPDIDRIYAIMLRNRLLPPPPPELSGQALKIEYISMLAQMQRAASTSGIERLAAFVGNLAAAQPGVLDNIDFDEMIDEYADLLGVNPRVVRSIVQVAQIRNQRAQSQAQQQGLQNSLAAVQGAQTLSQTDVGGGQNALQQILYGPGAMKQAA